MIAVGTLGIRGMLRLERSNRDSRESPGEQAKNRPINKNHKKRKTKRKTKTKKNLKKKEKIK